MIIENNKVVTMHYTVMDTDDNIIDSSTDDKPLVFMQGKGFLIPGLEAAIVGKQAGDEFSIEIPAKEGYGERMDTLLQSVPASMFEGMDVQPGMQFRAETDDGEQTVIVLDVDDENVVVDGNHPLAGIDLKFDVEIIDVRMATVQELAHGHAHDDDSSCS